MSKTLVRFELCDGMIIGTYDPVTGEIDELHDWNGNNVSSHMEDIAEDYVRDRMA